MELNMLSLWPVLLTLHHNATHSLPYYCVTYYGERECAPHGALGLMEGVSENGLFWMQPKCRQRQESICFTTKEQAKEWINRGNRAENWLIALGECKVVPLKRRTTGTVMRVQEIKITEPKWGWGESNEDHLF